MKKDFSEEESFFLFYSNSYLRYIISNVSYPWTIFFSKMSAIRT